MDSTIHSHIVSFIWGIPEDMMHDIYVHGEYRDVLLTKAVVHHGVVRQPYPQVRGTVQVDRLIPRKAITSNRRSTA